MKRLLFVCLIIAGLSELSFAQDKIFTRTGTISFSAGTAIEDIDGVNKSVTSVVDTKSVQIEFAVLMKGFEFKRALMQDHFNENYMESEKYPKAVFKGQITDLASLNFTKDGSYKVIIKGTLDMHGVKKDIEAPGTFVVKSGAISGESDFTVQLADFKIEIPGAVADKLSPSVKVHVSCAYKSL